MPTDQDSRTCPVCGASQPLAAEYDAELQRAQRAVENLQIALESARHISAAIGILVERMKITMDEAFDILVFVSQHEHRKLRDIAEELLFTGSLPDSWIRRSA